MMLAPTATRVPRRTRPDVNDRIARQTAANIEFYRAHPELIEQRLEELDREWDTERALEVMSSSLTGVGLILGIAGSRKWLLLPAVVQGFFLQHAIEGWCPPLPLIRSLGVRTQREIDEERTALASFRGPDRPR